MTSAQFAEEMVYYQLEPWGDDWERTSLEASLFYNANRGRNTKAIEADHFIPRKPEPRKMRPETMLKVLKMHAAAHNPWIQRNA